VPACQPFSCLYLFGLTPNPARRMLPMTKVTALGGARMVIERPARHPEPPIRWRASNLLLLLPLATLFAPLYNRIEPRLLGLPFFYWFLLVVVLLTVVLTALIFGLTRDGEGRAGR
jgi:hypothetical protein